MKIYAFSVLASVTLLFSACGGSGGNNDESTASYISIGITDGPVESASAVVVSFTAIELHGAENRLIEFEEPQNINLLDYQGEERALLLDGQALSPGDYQWIRLTVDEAASYIEVDGSQHSLEIPSAAQTGLKINRGFTIAANGTTDFTIDFDLRKSVHQEGTGDYKLRPTLRLVNNLEINTINGTVAEALLTNAECSNGDNNDTGNAVYLFSGHDASIQDLQGTGGDPLTTATVSYNTEDEVYAFTLGYIPLGDYSLVFTCDASLDMNSEDNSDVVSFSTPVNITVAEGDLTSASIQ